MSVAFADPSGQLYAHTSDAESDMVDAIRSECGFILQGRIDKDETSWRLVMSGEDTHWSAEEVRAEIVGDARAEVDEIERSEPDLAASYREHAVLRQGDRIGEWD